MTDSNIIKAKLHIATREYCFIEVEIEGTEEEIVQTNDRLSNLVNDKSELSASDWKKARMTMLLKGEFDPNDGEQLSKAQQYFINQAKLAFRDIKDKE